MNSNDISILRSRLQGINLYFVGMMGAGKSTIGQLVGQTLSYQFFDTDRVIEQAAGQSVSQIFTTSGESSFRQLETQVLAELSAYTRLVIATGGGIVSQPQNWSYLQQGLVIWLNVPIELIYSRLKKDTTRPLLQTADPLAKLQLLMQERRPLYAEADLEIVVRPGEPAERVASRVIDRIPEALKGT